jgi:integrase
MGHADKSMVDKVYGKYREGIEHERKQILCFYGEDFARGKNDAATPSGEEMAASWESFGKVGA